MRVRVFRSIKDWWHDHEIMLTLTVIVVLLLVALSWRSIVVSIRPGELGVRWSRFYGTATNEIYPEGTAFLLPWDVMTIYNVRYQLIDRKFDVLSRDGLTMTVSLSIRYRPEERLIGRLHQQVGPDYANVVIIPEVEAAARDVIGKFRPEDIYTRSFDEIQGDIVELAREQVRTRYIFLDDVEIRGIELPKLIADAIQKKLEAEQQSLEMQYELQRERQEADRKRIEGAGVRDFQMLIGQGMSEGFLRYKGIEATLQLAQSPNTKVVIVGQNPTGLPLILGDTAAAAPNAAPGRR